MKDVLMYIDKWAHEIAGTVIVVAGAVAVMDPGAVNALLGPKAAGYIALAGGVIQIARSTQDRLRAARQPDSTQEKQP